MCYYDDLQIEQSYEINELSLPIKRAIDYIEKHYHEQISLDLVAEKVDLNAEYLSRSFKKEVGQTYSSFLSKLRLTKAQTLLVETNDPVKLIANTVGYNNVSYFSSLFKKEFGVNPHEYRNKNFKIIRK